MNDVFELTAKAEQVVDPHYTPPVEPTLDTPMLEIAAGDTFALPVKPLDVEEPELTVYGMRVEIRAGTLEDFQAALATLSAEQLEASAAAGATLVYLGPDSFFPFDLVF